jgi:hypothetical protein
LVFLGMWRRIRLFVCIKGGVSNISLKLIFNIFSIFNLLFKLGFSFFELFCCYKCIQSLKFGNSIFKSEHIFCFLLDCIHSFLHYHKYTMNSSPTLFCSYFTFSSFLIKDYWFTLIFNSANLSRSLNSLLANFYCPSDPSSYWIFRRHCLTIAKFVLRYLLKD